jgi:hypothetical protein
VSGGLDRPEGDILYFRERPHAQNLLRDSRSAHRDDVGSLANGAAIFRAAVQRGAPRLSSVANSALYDRRERKTEHLR